jgi:hypothetical protein
MFVRFRGSPNRLQISIVETRRLNGRVRHEHIASLGSIERPPLTRSCPEQMRILDTPSNVAPELTGVDVASGTMGSG